MMVIVWETDALCANVQPAQLDSLKDDQAGPHLAFTLARYRLNKSLRERERVPIHWHAHSITLSP